MVNKTILFFKTLNEKQILLLLLGMAFGLRLYAVLMAKGIAYDSASYGFMARNFLDGDFIKGLSYPFHPLYPFLISLVSFDSAHVEIAGRLISLFWDSDSDSGFLFSQRDAGIERGHAFGPIVFSSSLSGHLFWNAPIRSHLLGVTHIVCLFFLDGVEARENF